MRQMLGGNVDFGEQLGIGDGGVDSALVNQEGRPVAVSKCGRDEPRENRLGRRASFGGHGLAPHPLPGASPIGARRTIRVDRRAQYRGHTFDGQNSPG